MADKRHSMRRPSLDSALRSRNRTASDPRLSLDLIDYPVGGTLEDKTVRGPRSGSSITVISRHSASLEASLRTSTYDGKRGTGAAEGGASEKTGGRRRRSSTSRTSYLPSAARRSCALLEAAGEVFSYVEDAAPVRRLSKEGPVRRLSKGGISEFQGDDVSYQSYAAAPPRWEEHVNVAERARKWRLSFEEVQGIVDGFRAADRGLGLISREDLFTVFKTTDWGANVPDKIVLRAWTAIAGGSDSVPWIKILDVFLEWYRANIFGPITLANQSAEESLTYELARKMQEMPQTIDSLRRRFHEFDTDGSGQICYDEFLLIMCKVMGIKDASLTCDKRFQRYWREADTDGSGEISFEEFCFWYLNNFRANGQLPYQKPSRN